MADDEQTTEMVTTPAGETPAASTQTQAAPTETVSKAEFEKLQAALKAANKEAAERRKLLDQYENEKKQKAEAEMTEAEKLKTQLEAERKQREQLAAELEQRKRDDTKRDIAAKVGLPAAFATRIQGDDAEAMEADAKALLAAMPKPAEPAQPEQPAEPRRPKSPGINPTNPGGNATTPNREAELRELIYGGGQRSGYLNLDEAVRHGGGVVYKSKNEA